MISAPGIEPSALRKLSGRVSIIVIPSLRPILSFAVEGSIRWIDSRFFSRYASIWLGIVICGVSGVIVSTDTVCTTRILVEGYIPFTE
jgi:hypothetical protein